MINHLLHIFTAFNLGLAGGLALARLYFLPKLEARHLRELENLARVSQIPGGAEALVAAARERARRKMSDAELFLEDLERRSVERFRRRAEEIRENHRRADELRKLPKNGST